MKYRSLLESRTPAIPITRSLGNPLVWAARNVISSSGFVTTMMIASGDSDAVLFTTSRMMPAFFSRRSMRLMPGWRGSPAVITTTSEPAVSL
jgi:hypothetical protein